MASPNGNSPFAGHSLHSVSAPNGPPDQNTDGLEGPHTGGGSRIRNASSTSSNISIPSASQESFGSSEKDFDKIGQDEVAEIPRELLADYGSRMAQEVLQQVTQKPQEAAQVSTPSNDQPEEELASPLSGYNYTMDERDLYVPSKAAEAEEHPIGGGEDTAATPQQTLAYGAGEVHRAPMHHHVEDQPIKELPEEDQPADADLLGLNASHSPNEEPASHPYASTGAHEPTVDELHELLGTQPAAYSNYGFNLGGDAEEEQDVEARINTAVADLTGEQQGYRPPHREQQQETIPESSSITGMRDAATDEEDTYERRGPLTLPVSADEDALTPEEVEKMRVHHWPRPPTPPKVLDDEPEEQKPRVVDLSHSTHPHHLVHKKSETGLHSILKNNGGSGEWWSSTDGVHPKVLEIIYWRDPKKSAGALAVVLFALYLVARCTLLSLAAYGALAVLGAAVGFRLYKLVEAQVKKTDGSNPFKPYLEQEVAVPRERLHEQVDVLLEHGQALFKHLRHLFLVESVVDSVKFGLLLYTLTYVGAWFSGISLILIFVLAVFSVPKVYELYKEPIDKYIDIAREHIEKIQHTAEDKLPFLKKLTAGEVVEKKKEQ